MGCTLKLAQKLFNEEFCCACTKTEAITLNVLAPSAEEELKTDLQEAKLASVFCDVSNHKDLKVRLVTERYFTVSAGVQTKLFETDTLAGETSAMMSQYIMAALEANQVISKLVAFSADNAKCNFSGTARNVKNVFLRLQDSMDHKIFGIGCAVHIVHDTIKTAGDCLPLDIEAVIAKIYS